VTRAALAVGFAAVTAVLWEFAEYVAFVPGSAEAATAYADTLGDLALGVSRRIHRLDRDGEAGLPGGTPLAAGARVRAQLPRGTVLVAFAAHQNEVTEGYLSAAHR
jgi:hypothetical protein